MTNKLFAIVGALLLVIHSSAQGTQKEYQKLTVGYTPIAAGSLPLFIAVEERIFQKYGYEVSPVFMGGSPLINSAILAGEFPIGYTGGGAVIASRMSGSDLIAIAVPLPVLTIDGLSRPEIKSIGDLKGKRIGVTRIGASTYFAALSMLESAGVKANEVAFIQNGGIGESYAALRNGLVDASMLGYPFALYAKTPASTRCSSLRRANLACFPTKSSRPGSRGSRTRETEKSPSTFYARSTKDSSSPEEMPRPPSVRCGDLPESTMTCLCRAALNTTGMLSRLR